MSHTLFSSTLLSSASESQALHPYEFPTYPASLPSAQMTNRSDDSINPSHEVSFTSSSLFEETQDYQLTPPLLPSSPPRRASTATTTDKAKPKAKSVSFPDSPPRRTTSSSGYQLYEEPVETVVSNSRQHVLEYTGSQFGYLLVASLLIYLASVTEVGLGTLDVAGSSVLIALCKVLSLSACISSISLVVFIPAALRKNVPSHRFDPFVENVGLLTYLLFSASVLCLAWSQLGWLCLASLLLLTLFLRFTYTQNAKL